MDPLTHVRAEGPWETAGLDGAKRDIVRREAPEYSNRGGDPPTFAGEPEEARAALELTDISLRKQLYSLHMLLTW
jgi:hypothetical protein